MLPLPFNNFKLFQTAQSPSTVASFTCLWLNCWGTFPATHTGWITLVHRAVHIYDWLDSTSPAATICATDPVTTHYYSFPHLRTVLTLLCHTWEVFSRAVSLVKPQDGSFTSSEQPTSTLHHLLYTAVIQFQPKHSDILSLLRYLQMRGEKKLLATAQTVLHDNCKAC